MSLKHFFYELSATMKLKSIAAVISFIFTLQSSLFGQADIEIIVNQGINFHDDGQYDKAIEKYKEALEIDPNSLWVHYEISMSYLYNQQYEKSIEHCDIIIDTDDKYVKDAYVTKGSSLDYMGETKKSNKLLKKGIRKFGDYYLFHYNLAYNYVGTKDYDKAEESLLKGLIDNPNHASSHLLLGLVNSNQKKKVKSIMSLCYFLLLEPSSERSKTAFKELVKLMWGSQQKKDEDSNEITIYIDSDIKDKDYESVEMMMPLLFATNSMEENKEKSHAELFADNLTTLFKILGETEEKEKRKSEAVWWDLYIPLFYPMAEAEHSEVFAYFISYNFWEESTEWLENNPDRIDAFQEWFKDGEE